MQLFEKRMISWKLNLNVSNQQAKADDLTESNRGQV